MGPLPAHSEVKCLKFDVTMLSFKIKDHFKHVKCNATLNSRISFLLLLFKSPTFQVNVLFFFNTTRKSYMLFYLKIFDLLEEACLLNPGGNSNVINL